MEVGAAAGVAGVGSAEGGEEEGASGAAGGAGREARGPAPFPARLCASRRATTVAVCLNANVVTCCIAMS